MTEDGRQRNETRLKAFIQNDMRNHGGCVTFAGFMELALYAPGLGYYARRDRIQVGRKGDFITSVSVGPLFGRIVARQLETWRLGLKDFEVVEYGAHRGQLQRDVLEVLPDLKYRLVDLDDAEPESISGCVLSNEFLDALPVHRVRVVNGAWCEIYVRDDFREETGPLSTPRLLDELKDLPTDLMEGYTTEVNLCALDWQSSVARRLRRGYVMTFDYGYERQDYFAPHRKDGTLTCYRQHQKSSGPYANLGQQDITAHVNFTSLIERGKLDGLEPILFQDQGRYLLEAGSEDIARIVSRDAGRFSRERAAIHQLTHPGMMGQALKVLIQKKV